MRIPSCCAIALFSVVVGTPALAYRTGADAGGFDTCERVRWEESSIEYELSDWIPPALELSAVETAVAEAFAVWDAAACADLTLTSGGWVSTTAASGDGRLTIQWLGTDWTAWGFDAGAAATTLIVYEQDAGGWWHITDADIYVNADLFTWTTTGAAGARDIGAVLTHEIGHALGLLHPCEIDGAGGAPTCAAEQEGLTMYPLYVGEEQRTLESDDLDGICFLYPASPCASACVEGEECSYDGCAPLCDGVLCTPGSRCGPQGCTMEPCVPGSCERGCEATCDPTLMADGDPCDADADCVSGHCAPTGLCASPCVDGTCESTDFYCDGNLAVPLCLSTLGAMGEVCFGADDCQSGYCLSGATMDPICTRRCGVTEQRCPDTTACEDVDGVDVCVPLQTGGGGCAVGDRGSLAGGLLLFLLALRPRCRKGRST